MWSRLGIVGWLWYCGRWYSSWRNWELLVCFHTFSFNLLTSFSAFKYLCRARGDKLEKNKIFYACLARVVRDGGFKIALIVRWSAIPGHCASIEASIFLFLKIAQLPLPFFRHAE